MQLSSHPPIASTLMTTMTLPLTSSTTTTPPFRPSLQSRLHSAQLGLPSDIILIDSDATHMVTPHVLDLHNPVPSPITTIPGIDGAKQIKIMQVFEWTLVPKCAMCPKSSQSSRPSQNYPSCLWKRCRNVFNELLPFLPAPESIITILVSGLYRLQTLPGHHLLVASSITMSLSTVVNRLKRKRLMRSSVTCPRRKCVFYERYYPSMGCYQRALSYGGRVLPASKVTCEPSATVSELIRISQVHRLSRLRKELSLVACSAFACRHTNTWFTYALRTKSA